MQKLNPAFTTWPGHGSLQTIPVPPQNFRTHCLYNLEMFHFSCQLPTCCYSKIILGRFAISSPSNLHRAQTAAPRPSLRWSGDNGTATEADPPHPANRSPEVLLISQERHPSSTSCSPATLNPANPNEQQTKPLSKINGRLAARKLTSVASRLQFLFAFLRGRPLAEPPTGFSHPPQAPQLT